MIEQRTAHTADLDDDTKTAIRALMDASFQSFSDIAFGNALGGMHALVFEDADLIGHASVVQRRLLHRGQALRTGYIEGVAWRGVVAAASGVAVKRQFLRHRERLARQHASPVKFRLLQREVTPHPQPYAGQPLDGWLHWPRFLD